jgi:hypothetical protein
VPHPLQEQADRISAPAPDRRSRTVGLIAAVLGPIMLLAALIGWAVSTPLASSPDEDFHLASIWCGLGERPGLCEAGSQPELRKVPEEVLVAHRCFDHQPDQAATCPRQAPDVLVETDRGNFDQTYPPVFYAVAGVFASPDLSRSIILIRALNAVLYVGLASALFFLLPRRRRGILLWTGLATLVPFGMFLIPSANPSSWGIISATTMWLAVLGYFEAEHRSRRFGLAAVAAVALLLGAGSRSDAAAFAAVAIVLGTVLAFRRTRAFALRSIYPAVLFVVAVATFLAAGQSNAVNPSFEVSVPLDALSTQLSRVQLLWLNATRLPELWAGAFGAPIGTQSLWLGTTTPGIVWVPTLAVFGGVLLWGLQTMRWRKALAVAAVGFLLVALPMIWLMRDQILVGQGVQARYLYPMMIMLAALSLLDLDGLRVRFNAWQLIAIATVAFVANAVIQWITLRRYVTGLDAHWLDLDTAAEWWWQAMPVGPMGVWVLSSAVFAVFCVVCVAASLAEREERPALT